MDVLNVDGYVGDAHHDKTAVRLYAEMSALPELVIQAEQAIARGIKMARILKNVETDQIAAKERLEDHFAVLKHFVNVP